MSTKILDPWTPDPLWAQWNCDDIGEGACPVHARENALQNEMIALRNQVAAYEDVLATRREHAAREEERTLADRDAWERQQRENTLLLACYRRENETLLAAADTAQSALRDACSEAHAAAKENEAMLLAIAKLSAELAKPEKERIAEFMADVREAQALRSLRARSGKV